MKNRSKFVVLKFGSSVLRSENDLPTAVHEIYRHWRQGERVVAVVSAFGNTTDELMRRAESVCSKPDRSTLATLLATGEAASSALLGLALNKVGIQARVLDAAQAGLRTVGGRLDADPIAVDTARLSAESRRAVVVLPGFVGRGESGDTTLLGRGGSDLTALFLAHCLSARCILIKDVDGLYTSDPASADLLPSRFAEVSYDTARRVGGSVVQLKAIRFAEAQGLRFSISAIGAGAATEVGPFCDRIGSSEVLPKPLRVALLGCGTVGGGVYQRLASLTSLFKIVGVGTRTCKRTRALGVPDQLVTNDLEELLERECDVVVELIGGTNYAASLASATLKSRRHFVTANKALMAAEGERLAALAAESGVTLRYSAAVGGVLPALEAVARARTSGPIRRFSGVLNGTTNYVLERLAVGEDFRSAISAAQQAGYAEANPQLDLDGTDATQKLVLLMREAFGASPSFNAIERNGINEGVLELVRESRRRGQSVRLVAQCSHTTDGLKASVKPTVLSADHPLSEVGGAQNRLIIEPERGEPLTVSGMGAGRWPTTEAVMADLFDIRRSQFTEELKECAA